MAFHERQHHRRRRTGRLVRGVRLQCGGVVSEIDLIDLNADLCRGQALDLLHGASLAADQRIRATGYEAIPESDLICITAGLRRKPDESRLDLINRNVELFLNILGQVKAAGPKKARSSWSSRTRSTCYLPGDDAAWSALDQVIGLGTQLDSARFRSLIAEALSLPADAGHGHDPRRARRQHGPDLVGRAGRRDCRSTSSPAGPQARPTPSSPGPRAAAPRSSSSRGARGSPSGSRSATSIHSIALDQKRILPVASLVNGPYGIRDVCISVPTVVGRRGVEAQLEIDLWPKEVSALQHSAQVLRETIDQVLKKNPTPRRSRPDASPAAPAAASGDGRAGDDGLGRRATGRRQVPR